MQYSSPGNPLSMPQGFGSSWQGLARETTKPSHSFGWSIGASMPAVGAWLAIIPAEAAPAVADGAACMPAWPGVMLAPIPAPVLAGDCGAVCGIGVEMPACPAEDGMSSPPHPATSSVMATVRIATFAPSNRAFI
jgi:hypothetical protein